MKKSIILIMFLPIILLSQTKKEQISYLNTKIDSLSSVNLKIKQQKDSLVNVFKLKNLEINQLQIELKTINNKFDTFKKSNDFLKVKIQLLEDSIKYVSDIDGNKYKKIIINDFIWLDRPLMTTTFFDGQPIIKSKNPAEFINNTNNKIPTYCFVDFNEKNKNLGLIYNKYCWLGNKFIGPMGFRVPDEIDLNQIFRYSEIFNKIDRNDNIFTYSKHTRHKDSLISYLITQSFNPDKEIQRFEQSNFSDMKVLLSQSKIDERNVVIPVTGKVRIINNIDHSDYFCVCGINTEKKATEGNDEVILGLPIYCCKKNK